MKQGRTIDALIAEVNRQHAAKKDVLATTRLMSVYTEESDDGHALSSLMDLQGEGLFEINEHAHSQLASLLSIPKAYYDRMRREKPALYDDNVNTWLKAAPADEKRLVRALDGNVRAVLSQRYRMLDNIDLIKFVLPVFEEFPALQVMSTEITESRLYIKVALPTLLREIKRGMMVAFGAEFGTSEIGAGTFYALPFSTVLDCTNGARHDNYGKKRNHVGRKLETESDFETFYADDTRAADDMAFFLKFRDTVRAILSGEVADKIANQMRIAAGAEIPEPEATIEVLAKSAGFSEDEEAMVTRFMMRGGDTSMWGLANAVTRTAQEIEDYDRASAFEVLGGKLIDLSASEWRVLPGDSQDRVAAMPLPTDISLALVAG